MKRHLRHLVMFTCISTTALLGAQGSFAGNTPPEDGSRKGCVERQKHGNHGDRFGRMARELGLSEQQKKETRALFHAGREENAPLFTALRKERRELHEMVRSGRADEAAIRAQSAKVAALQADFSVRRGAQARQFVALLTPEQAAKYQSLREKHRGNRGDRRFDRTEW